MSKPKIIDIRINQHGGEKEIQIDWSNDRHHGVKVRHDEDAIAVSDALHRMAEMIRRDPGLK